MRPGKDRQSRLLDLIGRVYDAALDDKLWPGLAPQIARTFDSISTAVQVRDMRQGTVELLAMTQNYSAGLLQSYESHYAARDVWVERATAIGPSKVVTSADLIADKEFECTEFCNDWCHEASVFYVVGSVFPINDDKLCAVGIHRPRSSSKPYGEEDKRGVAQFLPHLQRALQMRQRLVDPAVERQAALEALERSGKATLVANGAGRIIYANAAAERLLGEGGALRTVGGRLALGERTATQRLTALIQGAADAAAGRGGSPADALAIERPGRLPLTVLVAPFRPAREGLGAPLPAAILFLRDPEAARTSTLALRGLFGLTAAEAPIAAAIADGTSIEAIARALCITLNTARTHLKNIYAKTNTNRQSQLVALLLRSVAVMV
jgi:DNA-binding CsgD family transcriptional regulator/PAS domain-containing protein